MHKFYTIRPKNDESSHPFLKVERPSGRMRMVDNPRLATRLTMKQVAVVLEHYKKILPDREFTVEEHPYN